MGFGLLQNRNTTSNKHEVYINTGTGYVLYSSSNITLNEPETLHGYVENAREISVYINGILANKLFTFTKKANRIEFAYTENIALFNNTIELLMEITQ